MTRRGSGSRTAARARAARRRCSNGRVYTFGATGILNVLDEATGRVIWSRNAGTDSNTTVPDWGFSASPLLIDDLVIVAAAGKLVAYDRGDRAAALGRARRRSRLQLAARPHHSGGAADSPSRRERRHQRVAVNRRAACGM